MKGLRRLTKNSCRFRDVQPFPVVDAAVQSLAPELVCNAVLRSRPAGLELLAQQKERHLTHFVM
jgi:hypothetical protein